MVSAPSQPGEVRSEVLSAATRLFARRGFADTSLQLIADEVGVTKQAVLHYFASKSALRQAVLDSMLDHWRDVLPGLLLAASASEDRFDAVIGELYRFFTDDPDRARLIMREMLDRPEEARKLMHDSVRPWLLAVAGYIKQGQEHGRHHGDVDPETYVLHMLQLVLAAVSSAGVSTAAIEPASDAGYRYEHELLRIARAALFREEAPTDKRRSAEKR